MYYTIKKLTKPLFYLIIVSYTSIICAQDGKIYPLETPKEPNAIPLNTGGVENQPASETWFRQWGDPMHRHRL